MNALKQLKELDYNRWRQAHPTIDRRYYAPKSFSDRTANGLTKAIIHFTRLMGGQAERISSEGRVIDRRRVVTDCIGRMKQIGSVQRIYSGTTNGTADISATIAGRAVKIEVKVGRDKQSEAQKNYQETVEAAGGIYLVIRDFETYFRWLKNFLEKTEK